MLLLSNNHMVLNKQMLGFLDYPTCGEGSNVSGHGCEIETIQKLLRL